MTIWDGVILLVAAALVLGGLWKGALRLALSLAGLLAAFLFSGRLADLLGRTMAGRIPLLAGPPVRIAAFLLILAGFVLAGILASKLAHEAGLGLLNRLLGAILGFLLAVYLAGGLVQAAGRLSPAFRARVEAGPVVRTMACWAMGIRALVPDPPLRPAPVPQSPPSETGGRRL